MNECFSQKDLHFANLIRTRPLRGRP